MNKSSQHITAAQIQSFEKRKRTHFINSLSGFKSVCLAGTINTEGQTNLSIISSVIHIGANPALMGFIMRPVSVPRHTYQNIIETRQFTLNHIQSDFYRQAHQTSARYPQEVSEFQATGLQELYSEKIQAPYVKESNVRVGLHFVEKTEIKANNTILIIGEIQEVFVPENCLAEDGYLDIEKAGTITCSSLDSYHTTNRIGRLSYAKPDRVIEEITT